MLWIKTIQFGGFRAVFVAGLIASFILPGCVPSGNEDSSRVFRYNQAGGISSLDPAFARNQANIWAVHQLYNGLVTFDRNLRIIPCLAKSWEISQDRCTYTFHLRTDVRFHDDPAFPGGQGRILEAEDVVYSFSRLLDPLVASPGAWIFQDKVDTLNPFEAPDDSTFILRLRQPFRAMLGILTMEYCNIVPREAVEYYGQSFRKHPVGTGPFRFVKWQEGNALILDRNPAYFQADSLGRPLPYLDRVIIFFIDNKSTEFLTFLDGNLDFVSDFDPGLKELILTPEGELNPEFAGKMQLLKHSYLNTEYLGLLVDSTLEVMDNSPLLDPRVRLAINYGFDRERLVQFLRNGKGEPATHGMIPPGLPGYDAGAEYGFSYDPEKARALLAEAGYPGGKNMPSIELSAPPTYADICEFIQNQLQETGIPVQLHIMQPSALRSAMERSELPFFRASWIADYPDAESYMALFYSRYGAPPNYTRYHNPLADSLYDNAVAETDPDKAARLYRAMDSLVMRDAPVVPLYYDEVFRFVAPGVHGLRPNAMNILDLSKVWKE